MAATQKAPVRGRAGVRPAPPEPPEPPRSPVAAIALMALMVIAAAIGTGIVLISRGGSEATTRGAAQAPTATSEPRQAAATATPSAAAKIAVTLREFSVGPQPAIGRAGRVTFRVRNAGRVKHEFVVLRTAKPASGLKKGSEADEAGNVGEIGDLPPGATKTLKLALKPGHYALVCNLPGHYLAGQYADFTVR
jgi:uncharacterized cupredoxin-like copper-binding protein